MGVLRADRTEVLQEMLPPGHVSITQLPLGPCVPWEQSTGPAPGWLQAGQQERSPGAALRQRCTQRTCSEHPSISMHPGWWALPAPGRSSTARSHRPPPPAGSNAPRLTLLRFLGVPVPGRTAWKLPGAKQHQPKPLSAAERKKSELGGKANGSLVLSYSPRAGARRQSWRSREGAIHKPPTVSGRGRGGSRGPRWGASGCPHGAVPGHQP